MKQYKTVNNLIGWITFIIAATVYCMTIEPTASFWDCPEFITTGYKLEVGHPPGAPFFMLVANLFSQFASDLDADTRKQLERGRRMVEILKQGVNSPIAFEKQASLIFAGNEGYLDKLSVEQVKEFEKSLYLALDNEKSTAEPIRSAKDLSDDSKASLKKIFADIVATI